MIGIEPEARKYLELPLLNETMHTHMPLPYILELSLQKRKKKKLLYLAAPCKSCKRFIFEEENLELYASWKEREEKEG